MGRPSYQRQKSCMIVPSLTMYTNYKQSEAALKISTPNRTCLTSWVSSLTGEELMNWHFVARVLFYPLVSDGLLFLQVCVMMAAVDNDNNPEITNSFICLWTYRQINTASCHKSDCYLCFRCSLFCMGMKMLISHFEGRMWTEGVRDHSTEVKK